MSRYSTLSSNTASRRLHLTEPFIQYDSEDVKHLDSKDQQNIKLAYDRCITEISIGHNIGNYYMIMYFVKTYMPEYMHFINSYLIGICKAKQYSVYDLLKNVPLTQHREKIYGLLNACDAARIDLRHVDQDNIYMIANGAGYGIGELLVYLYVKRFFKRYSRRTPKNITLVLIDYAYDTTNICNSDRHSIDIPIGIKKSQENDIHIQYLPSFEDASIIYRHSNRRSNRPYYYMFSINMRYNCNPDFSNMTGKALYEKIMKYLEHIAMRSYIMGIHKGLSDKGQANKYIWDADFVHVPSEMFKTFEIVKKEDILSEYNYNYTYKNIKDSLSDEDQANIEAYVNRINSYENYGIDTVVPRDRRRYATPYEEPLPGY